MLNNTHLDGEALAERDLYGIIDLKASITSKGILSLLSSSFPHQ